MVRKQGIPTFQQKIVEQCDDYEWVRVATTILSRRIFDVGSDESECPDSAPVKYGFAESEDPINPRCRAAALYTSKLPQL